MVELARNVERLAITQAAVLGTIVLAGLTLIQLRVLSFVLLWVLGAVYVFHQHYHYPRTTAALWVAFLLSVFIPVDVALGSFYWGYRVGASPGGPHFVTFVVGKPAHTRLLQTYGEYISGGCMFPALIPPRWILVWN
jgi:hypothetical protein